MDRTTRPAGAGTSNLSELLTPSGKSALRMPVALVRNILAGYFTPGALFPNGIPTAGIGPSAASGTEVTRPGARRPVSRFNG
jgi:hypothetical protein